MKSEAKSLIDSFAAQLLALNEGEAIPRKWKNHLLKAIRPAKKRRGAKVDSERTEALAKEITLGRDTFWADRTKSTEGKKGEAKSALAHKYSCSVRHVERVNKAVCAYLTDRELPPPDLHRAVVNGISAALSADIDAEFEAEFSAKVKRILGRDK